MLGYTMTLVAGIAVGIAIWKHRQKIAADAAHESTLLRIKAVASVHGILDQIKAAI